jgi:hypothetical protein
MQEENSTLGKNGSWRSFIFASICTLPLATFTFLRLMAENYGMLTLLDDLRFCAEFFSPLFPIVALLVLISVGFALKQHPKMFPILTLYTLIAVGHILTWFLILYIGD